MKILIINPNSSKKMTGAIQKAAEEFTRGEFEVFTESIPGAPEFIETYEDQVKAAPGMIQLIRDNEDTFDGFIVACHCDPNLDVMKEITEKPVVGIGEASMTLASMLGHRFSVVSTHKHSVPNKEALIRKYHLEGMLASVKAPPDDMDGCGDAEKTLSAARLAVEDDMAEVIVLGCAGMAGLDKQIQKELEVPVLDGVICALIIAAGLVKYGVSTSKIRRYNPVY
jgi:allantoin racemase